MLFVETFVIYLSEYREKIKAYFATLSSPGVVFINLTEYPALSILSTSSIEDNIILPTLDVCCSVILHQNDILLVVSLAYL